MSKTSKSLADNTAGGWWVYMVRSRTGKLYTGITTDIERRLREHQTDLGRGARFFRMDAAVEVVFRERADGRSEASRREAAIKKLTRRQKLLLIGEIPG